MRHHLGFYNNVGVTGYYYSPSSITLKPRISEAIAAIIRTHPILSAIPVDEGTKNPHFARLQSVNLEECIKFVERQKPYDGGCNDSELDELLAAQHNKAFEPFNGRPFWRLVIFVNPDDKTSFAACFIYHHALADGASGKAFHKAFLNAISGAECAPLSSTIVPSFEGPLLPALEELHPLPLSLMTLVKGFYHDNFSSVSPDTWSGAPVAAPLISKFRSLLVVPKTASRFAAACRREGTTITATLQTLLATALFGSLPKQCSELTCTVAVSLRRWMPPPVTEDSMGCWIASLEETCQRQAFSWTEARTSRRTIKKFLSQNGKDTNVGLLRWLSDYKHHFTSKIGTKRAISFEVTNIGAWPLNESSDINGWRIGRMVFSQSATVTGGAIEICVTSGGDGSMTLGYAWQEGVVDTKFIEQVMEDMQNQIELLSHAP